MFEATTPDSLLGEIETYQKWESMLIARRLAAIAGLLAHRTAEAEASDPDHGYSMITGFARTTAEVSAAMNLAPMTAKRMVSQADALDSRLPAVAALLADGRADWRTVQLVITRTELVDDALMPALDRSIAEGLTDWQCWSRRRVMNAVDAKVRALDPAAAKERRVTADTARHITVRAQPNGMAEVRGSLSAPVAAAFDKRLNEMAKSVCAGDSRTMMQRRSDAIMALSEGRELACDCGTTDCPSRAASVAPATGPIRTVINVVASEETLLGRSDEPAYLESYGVIDAEQLRELAESAVLRMVTRPTATEAEAHRYQPSAAMERWIRSRDLTCRFPGCDRPAWSADIDHTAPFNHAQPASGGKTTRFNLGCYCREHHRLKTFLTGPGGWRDEQLSDGTIVWTSPTGRTYRTTPDGAALFPQLRQACGMPPPRRSNHTREKARRRARARATLCALRPLNAEQTRLNRARREEIDARKWRNQMRKMLFLLKGTNSTSPWCTWVNDPLEPEHIPADWRPPPLPALDDTDEPPF